MVKKASLLALAALVSIMAGCGSTGAGNQPANPPASAAPADKEITIGVSTATLRHQFFIDIDNGMKKAAEEAGVKLLVNDPNLDLAKQVSAVEDYMQKGVNGLILLAVDNAGVVPVVEEAKEKGIPVITADSVVPSDKVDTFIGTENYEAGKQLGEHLKKQIEADGKDVKIAVVTHVQSFVQKERLRGFKEVLSNVSGVNILNDQPGYDREKSMATVENILQANPDVDYIYATAENSVLGALAALESAKNTKTKIVGFDVTPEAAEGIRGDKILAMIQQQPEKIGEAAVKAAIEAIKGKQLEKNISIPVILMDKSNVDEYFKK
ncbi:ribose ABC transporter substrate-binding protein [Brevibacillus reuszeri]|uniref:Ribose ABC transporter substrate-binding protein n=1 Tax=Brevibacillus reuszeri TaxID=54915 RepID=A0A0K9YP47_9BACL|nr:substrate-binding domain-containing protein [Brevibacillus reuszeri]KNB70499.1 sugar ABC transporter substrate-binding protein [Brevibacillus reuszeri]MED1861788.1 substrate-binding domain-containing protein [Brevibacillus reuszeri]GED72967.1 ribose ABC transporter substrate-binding protein [Brevibacillus reuszeri]